MDFDYNSEDDNSEDFFPHKNICDIIRKAVFSLKIRLGEICPPHLQNEVDGREVRIFKCTNILQWQQNLHSKFSSSWKMNIFVLVYWVDLLTPVVHNP